MVHVNLLDLIDAKRTGRRVRVFYSAMALAKYTQSRGRWFPKEAAKEDGFVKVLLRRVG